MQEVAVVLCCSDEQNEDCREALFHQRNGYVGLCRSEEHTSELQSLRDPVDLLSSPTRRSSDVKMQEVAVVLCCSDEQNEDCRESLFHQRNGYVGLCEIRLAPSEPSCPGRTPDR